MIKILEDTISFDKSKELSHAMYTNVKTSITNIFKQVDNLNVAINQLTTREEYSYIRMTNEQLHDIIESLSNIKTDIAITQDNITTHLNRFKSELNKKTSTN